MGVVRELLRSHHGISHLNARAVAAQRWQSGLLDECVARLDGALTKKLKDARTEGPSSVVLIGFDSQDAAEISDLLPQRYRIATNPACPLKSGMAIPSGAVVLVNAEHFDDLGDAVDALMTLRKTRPDLVVILASRSLNGDDLSLERSVACHASLRLPTRCGNVERVMRAATENAASLMKQGR
jgi:hypothetical protein